MVLGGLGSELRDPAECVIRVGVPGREVSELYPFVTEVTVDTSREKPSVATLQFATNRDEKGKWAVLDDEVLAPWEPIVIEAAFGSHQEEVMRGFIREIRPEFPEQAGATTCRVECQDESLALDREHIRRSWGETETPVTDSAILSEIAAGRHSLRIHPDSQGGLSGLVLLQNSTDVRFLRERAEANGYELVFREGEVYFGPMRLEADPQSTILVYAGPSTHCFQFSIRDDGHKPDQVAFELADETGPGFTRKVIDPDLAKLGPEPANSRSSGLQDFVWTMNRAGGARAEELEAQALRKANENAMKVQAEGELDGSLYRHVLRAGEPVPVDGVGERYSGTYYVDSVHHRFSAEGYRQKFTLLRNAYGENLAGSDNPLAGLF